MSKLVSVRIPDDLLVKLEGQRVTEVVVLALRKHFNPPVERKRGAVQMEGLPERLTAPLVDPDVRYRKPAHAPSCTCWICRPPKEGCRVSGIEIEYRHSDYGEDAGGYAVLRYGGKWIGRVTDTKAANEMKAAVDGLGARVRELELVLENLCHGGRENNRALDWDQAEAVLAKRT